MMEAMEGTLYQHGVDVVFAGHVHAYESSYPVFRSGLHWIGIMAASSLLCSVCTHHAEPQSAATRSRILLHSTLGVEQRRHPAKLDLLCKVLKSRSFTASIT